MAHAMSAAAPVVRTPAVIRRARVPGRASNRVGSVRASAGGRLAAPATSPLSERPNAAPADPFLALKGAMVHRATDGSLVDLSTTWSADEKGPCARAIQLRRDVKPVLDAAGVKLVAVSIGTPQRAVDFMEETGFPAENLFADPDNVCYERLQLNKSLKNFSQKSTPEMLMARWKKDGAKDLLDVFSHWKPWIPPKREQGFQQGGTFAFDGEDVLYAFYDPSTGVHAPFDDYLAAVGLPPLAVAPEPVPRKK